MENIKRFDSFINEKNCIKESTKKEGLHLSTYKSETYKRSVLDKALNKFENLEYNQEIDEEIINYMFFNNLQKIKRMCEELMKMDNKNVDNILKNGHSWAVDHISTSSDDLEEVYNFLKSEFENKKSQDTIISEK